jgi:hypothetical protein
MAMTPDERALLTNFLSELGAARGVAKDREADDLIRQAMSLNPDASYVLVQHAIVADQSLHAAQARIAELERQLNPQPSATSFLSPGAGPWGSAQPSYAPPPPDERPGIFSSGGGLGSFLRSAGTTAAGVAGGEMLFSGLSDLFGGHRGGMFGGGQGFMGGPEENVVINNYGDDDGDDRADW